MSVALRVAVLSDIHGNLAALKAVFAEMDQRGAYDQIVIDGDHCLNGPDPAAAFDLARERGTILLKGNTDRDIVDEGASDPDLGEKKRASIAWTREQLGSQRIDALDALAFEHRVIAPDDEVLQIVHANPHDLDRHIFPDMTEDDLADLLGDVESDILAFGHLHIPYERAFRSVRLFDIAAVGLPRDGDRRSAWGEFTWAPNVGWRGEIVRTPYDVLQTIERVLDSGMPNPEKRIRDLVKATYD
jgi:predicted phosphodiesterase